MFFMIYILTSYHRKSTSDLGPGDAGILKPLQGYKVQTRATQPLVDRGMNFGVRFAFDSGSDWGKLGLKFGKVILKLRDLSMI